MGCHMQAQTVRRQQGFLPAGSSRTPARPNPSIRHIMRSPVIQPKLKVGAANDPAEAEADHVADRVMRMPRPDAGNRASASGSPVGAILRGEPNVQRMCSECEDELHRKPADEPIRRERNDDDDLIQTKEAPGSSPALSGQTASAISGLRGGGTPLPASERAFFEPRFGRSFANVRIHNGGKADTAARSINARAFTLGNDVAFAQGQYRPGSSEGRRLMAHELTHTVQQGQGVQRQVVQRDTWSDVLDGLQVGLDVAGLIPAAGIVPDLINAGVSGLRGDAIGAAASLAAAVPGVGLAAGAGKLGVKGKRAWDAANAARDLAAAAAKRKAKAEAAQAAAKKAAKEKLSKEAAEAALRKKIAECEAIHAAYKALGNCRKCLASDTKEERATKIACITAVLAGRGKYLHKRCDYVLPGSIARGSAIAERGHKIQLAQFTKMLTNCGSLPTK